MIESTSRSLEIICDQAIPNGKQVQLYSVNIAHSTLEKWSNSPSLVNFTTASLFNISNPTPYFSISNKSIRMNLNDFTPGQEYLLLISAWNELGWSNTSQVRPIAVRMLAEPPSCPGSLSAIVVSSRSIVFGWMESFPNGAAVEQYEIESNSTKRGDTVEKTSIFISQTIEFDIIDDLQALKSSNHMYTHWPYGNASSAMQIWDLGYIIVDLQPGTRVCARVFSYNERGRSAKCETKCLDTNPEIPSTISVISSQKTENSLIFNWQWPESNGSPLIEFVLSIKVYSPESDLIVERELESAINITDVNPYDMKHEVDGLVPGQMVTMEASLHVFFFLHF